MFFVKCIGNVIDPADAVIEHYAVMSDTFHEQKKLDAASAQGAGAHEGGLIREKHVKRMGLRQNE